MTVIGWRAGCLVCGGPLRVVNPGSSYEHRAIAVYGCLDCGAEIHARLDLARVDGTGAARRSSTVIDKLAAEARSLISLGHSEAGACRTVGIDRHSYRARHRGRP